VEPLAQPPAILARSRVRAPADPLWLVSSPGPVVAIAASRCNRCGACLRLGCPAIADVGGEALVVDPSACTGCGACPPVCRARAIGPLR
jgi:TPP-dependent indolepyruvate ferredoxin oxidoreductase alpha subunit